MNNTKYNIFQNNNRGQYLIDLFAIANRFLQLTKKLIRIIIIAPEIAGEKRYWAEEGYYETRWLFPEQGSD